LRAIMAWWGCLDLYLCRFFIFIFCFITDSVSAKTRKHLYRQYIWTL